jgi:hypothetical protein
MDAKHRLPRDVPGEKQLVRGSTRTVDVEKVLVLSSVRVHTSYMACKSDFSRQASWDIEK